MFWCFLTLLMWASIFVDASFDYGIAQFADITAAKKLYRLPWLPTLSFVRFLCSLLLNLCIFVCGGVGGLHTHTEGFPNFVCTLEISCFIVMAIFFLYILVLQCHLCYILVCLTLGCILQDISIIRSVTWVKSSHCIVFFIKSCITKCGCKKDMKYLSWEYC